MDELHLQLSHYVILFPVHIQVGISGHRMPAVTKKQQMYKRIMRFLIDMYQSCEKITYKILRTIENYLIKIMNI